MHNRFLASIVAIAAINFAGAANLLALQMVTPPATLTEAPVDDTGMTQYTITNTSSSNTAGGPFDISLFLVTTTGNTPSTTNSGWTAETVNASSWTQYMGSTYYYRLTWQQFTGLTYTQAFPSDPASVNGYYLAYSVNTNTDAITFPSAQPITPGNSLGGFYFDGSPASTFFAAGPTDGTTSFQPGSVVTYTGTSTDLPEPSAVALAALAACACCRRWRGTFGINSRRA
jgi:hypothetical protein